MFNPFFTCYPLGRGYKGSTLIGHFSGTKKFQAFPKLPLERAQDFEQDRLCSDAVPTNLIVSHAQDISTNVIKLFFKKCTYPVKRGLKVKEVFVYMKIIYETLLLKNG